MRRGRRAASSGNWRSRGRSAPARASTPAPGRSRLVLVAFFVSSATVAASLVNACWSSAMASRSAISRASEPSSARAACTASAAPGSPRRSASSARTRRPIGRASATVASTSAATASRSRSARSRTSTRSSARAREAPPRAARRPSAAAMPGHSSRLSRAASSTLVSSSGPSAPGARSAIHDSAGAYSLGASSAPTAESRVRVSPRFCAIRARISCAAGPAARPWPRTCAASRVLPEARSIAAASALPSLPPGFSVASACSACGSPVASATAIRVAIGRERSRHTSPAISRAAETSKTTLARAPARARAAAAGSPAASAAAAVTNGRSRPTEPRGRSDKLSPMVSVASRISAITSRLRSPRGASSWMVVRTAPPGPRISRMTSRRVPTAVARPVTRRSAFVAAIKAGASVVPAFAIALRDTAG